MSIKRQATTDLNHENWDQDDPSEHEEMGSFKSAPKDILEKRVIRTAKRRTQASGDESKKSVFSGFGGFNKAQPSSFDFLANLTNGSNTTNGTTTSKADSSVSSNLFSSKPTMSSSSTGLFSTPVSSTPPSKPTFGTPTTKASVFGGLPPNPSAAQTPFASSKADVTGSDSLFKTKSSPNTTEGNSNDVLKNTNANTNSIFGASPGNNKSQFSINVGSSPFKASQASASTNKSTIENDSEKKTEDKSEDKKLKYYAKLKGLNESVSDWIKKHVEETPLCILSPIFKDYERYLKEIQDEYQGSAKDSIKGPSKSVVSDKPSAATTAKNTADTASNNSSLFSNKVLTSMFGTQNSNFPSGDKTAQGFSFGMNASSTATTTTTSESFSFGIKTAPQITTAATSAPFSLSTSSTTDSKGAPAAFSFGTGKPFSFNSNIQNTAEASKEKKDEEDEPPKVEFTPVVEENTVFDKRCKIFVKKDGNFADKGVATLYIKKVEESGKHQLLVRANTNLGNVLLNLILTSSIPTQRLGKNNVMLVCIPTPDPKAPPTPVLIRVKTSDEADALLETLNKYKA